VAGGVLRIIVVEAVEVRQLLNKDKGLVLFGGRQVASATDVLPKMESPLTVTYDLLQVPLLSQDFLFVRFSDWFHAFEQLCAEQGAQPQYVVEGLPRWSGLDFAEGALYGVPAAQFFNASQPAPLLVTVAASARLPYDQQTEATLYRAGRPVMQDVTVRKPVVVTFAPQYSAARADGSSSGSRNSAPMAVSAVASYVETKVGGFLLFNAAPLFVDADRDALSFSLKGLAPNSGLAVVAERGMLFGTLTAADAELASIHLDRLAVQVTIVATDGAGAIAEHTLYLRLPASSQHLADSTLLFGNPSSTKWVFFNLSFCLLSRCVISALLPP
jgi:hypothetical protein